MNINEKLEVLNSRISSILPHIYALEKDIAENPLEEVEGKPLRNEILSDFIKRKQALEAEINTLTNQG